MDNPKAVVPGAPDEDWPYFLERLIHDLREPLRSVHSYSELLAEMEDAPAPERARLRDEIVGGALRMRTLVDGLSAYALTLRPEKGEASLQLAFDMTVMALERPIRETGATVTAGELPRAAVSLERLLQLFENLIGNSLVFHGEGRPVINISAREEDAERWLVQVEDNGPGMEARDCDAVFKPFLRLHGRKYSGAGLGLTICRSIVASHGGRIWIESTPGAGSICRFTLPRSGS